MAKLIAHSSRSGQMGPQTRRWLAGERVPMQQWGGDSPERRVVDFICRDTVLCLFIVLGVLSLVCYLR